MVLLLSSLKGMQAVQRGKMQFYNTFTAQDH